jgi:26S proteasome non-ATPase regulatory subunit 9
MNGHLVDEDGYPRSDIDVYAVRVARNKVIRLQNDHKMLMGDIEKGLHTLHAREREQRRSESYSDETADQGGTGIQSFAEINSVAKNSPAEQAGLCVGDKLVQFGSISCENFRNLKDIGSLVQFSIERDIRVCVLRSSCQVNLTLTPRRWAGKGLLG